MYKISSAQLPVTEHTSFDGWANEMKTWVEEAVANESRLLLFPEWGSLALASLLPENERSNANDMLMAMQKFLPDFHDVFAGLAKQHNRIIVGTSFGVLDKGNIYNRAFVYGSKGIMG